MKRVILKRFETGPQGTFGILIIDDLAFCTVELPSRNNKPFISRIPPKKNGKKKVYQVRWTYSPKFKRMMYLVQGVKGRWGIRFHSANWAGDKKLRYRSQLLGCIALGLKKSIIYGQKAVSQSRKAMKQFEDHMKGEPFELVILPE